MSIVEIRCPQCDERDHVAIGGMLLSGRSDESHDGPGAAAAWICSTCGDLVERPIDWHAFIALVGAGVPLLAEASRP